MGDEVDGTVHVELTPSVDPEQPDAAIPPTLWLYFDTRLARSGHVFRVALTESQLVEAAVACLRNWSVYNDPERGAPLVLDVANFHMQSPFGQTVAPRWPGARSEVLGRDLGVSWESWMQDWPVERADERRIAEFCAYYEAATDPLVRVDAMALAFESWNHSTVESKHDGWFYATLRRDFALHGHLVKQYARLGEALREIDDGAPFMRAVWRFSVKQVPVVLGE